MSSKSTFSNSTSASYAVALYELSKENAELDNVEIAMKSLKKLLNTNSDFKDMILSPHQGGREGSALEGNNNSNNDNKINQ